MANHQFDIQRNDEQFDGGNIRFTDVDTPSSANQVYICDHFYLPLHGLTIRATARWAAFAASSIRSVWGLFPTHHDLHEALATSLTIRMRRSFTVASYP